MPRANPLANAAKADADKASGESLSSEPEKAERDKIAEVPRRIAHHDRVQVDDGDHVAPCGVEQQVVDLAVAVDHAGSTRRFESVSQNVDHLAFRVCPGRRVIERRQVTLKVVKAVDDRLKRMGKRGEAGQKATVGRRSGGKQRAWQRLEVPGQAARKHPPTGRQARRSRTPPRSLSARAPPAACRHGPGRERGCA